MRDKKTIRNRIMSLALAAVVAVTMCLCPIFTEDVHAATVKGIDVSVWQGKSMKGVDINWQKVKNSGIKFAIIRCGYGATGIDTDFAFNASECERVGLPYGVYLYSHATSTADAVKEATFTIKLLKGHKPTLPIYYDLEAKQTAAKGKSTITKIANTYCKALKAAGYKPGIYANLTWWNKYLSDSSLNSYDKWVAQYYSKCSYTGTYSIWQYSSSGTVDGIKGKVDMNYLYNSSLLTGKGQDGNIISDIVQVTTPVKVLYKAVMKNRTNYRKGPGTSHKVMGSYKAGKIVNIVEEKNGWGKMKTSGYWIKLSNVLKTSSSIKNIGSFNFETTTSVNYRKGPGTKYSVVGTFKKGKKVKVAAKTGKWYLMTNGYYIHSSYVKEL